MAGKENASAIYRALGRRYPHAGCELNFANPFQLICATVLSAQCTDKRVNLVTPNLFRRFPSPEKLAAAKASEVEGIIESTGFFRTKAAHLIGLSQKIVVEFAGEVPGRLEDLITLPGVGRKTANVVLGHAFGVPGITVDTHFGRLSRRFGWTESDDPVKVEFEVGALIPQKNWTTLSQRLIWHGRRICHARKPACGACPLAKLCPSFGIGELDPIKAEGLVKSDDQFK